MRIAFFIACALIFASCNSTQTDVSGAPQTTPPPALAQFKLTSPDFNQGEFIPPTYTCDSSNISPELHWNKVSAKIVSYALIVDDPDAPMGTWVHWIVFNIPSSDTIFKASFPKDSALTNGTKQGITSFHSFGYGGPCPPEGTHRYFFKLYALDTTLTLSCTLANEIRLTTAMKSHILAETELMGKYQRIRRH